MRRHLAGLLLALCSLSSFAQTIPATSCPNGFFSRVSRANSTFEVSGPHATYEQACSSLNPFSGELSAASVTVNNGTQCVWKRSFDGYTLGPEIRFVGGTCEPPARRCPVSNGDSYSFNRTEGWSTSPNSGTPVHFNASPTGATYDTGECTVDISGGLQSEACYRSQTPAANGMYRVSCDYTGVVTGDSNGTSTPETDPNAAPPACPGTTGEVNGVPTCVPSSTGDTTPAPEKGQNDNGTGNPSAGRAPDGAEQGSRDGQSRTPQNGDGDNGGGPAAAFNPNGAPVGDQNSDGTEEQGEPCGGPGQPVCRVKVDESGVKSSGNYSKGETALKTASDAAVKALGDSTKQTDLGGREWSFTFPSGSCTPIALGFSIWHFTVDLCSFPNIELFRAFWAWAFGVMGALYIWRTVSSSIG